MKTTQDVRNIIKSKLQISGVINLNEVVALLDASEADVEKLTLADKRRTARRLISSLRDDDQTRACYAACDRTGAYVGVKRCCDAETLKLVESQLRKKRDGINKSLGKVSRLKKSLSKAVCAAGEDSSETKALAAKLYAMADELQTLLAM